MLRVKLLVEPGGDQKRVRDIGEIEVANVTRDPSRMSSDYIWRITSTTAANQPVRAEGYLVDSYNGSAVELVYEVLRQWKSGNRLPTDNHGNMTRPNGIQMDASDLWKRLDQMSRPDPSVR